MRQVREVLRLKHVCGHSGHQIAAMVGVSRYTVAEYLRRAAVVGITWPVPAGLDDVALEGQLFTPPFTSAQASRPQPDWSRIHAELRKPGVTLQLLWEEYRFGQPDGYGYSRFCDLHAAWRGRLSPTMRQTHPAGERMFVDYAGQTVEVIDGATGEVRRAQVFVAVLGASNYTYAEARWTQSLPDWIGCHVGAFASFGGAARQIVCDNLKAGVTAASRYEPGISRSYQDMATHYGTAILPARVRKPRDKAKVEVAVQVVQRWVLARLRHQRFFSLGELNSAIRALIADLNNRPMRHLGTSRRALFEAIEAGALLDMPAEPYAYAEWRRCRAGLDYHVEVYGHFYSVPYRLMREVIEARITDQTIELFHQTNRVACHVRNPRQHRHTTIAEHMPSAHPCPARTVATWSGRRRGCCARPRQSVRPPSPWWSASWRPNHILSRASAPASAFCAWCEATGLSGWRRPASAAWTSAPRPTARCSRSCAMASIVPTTPNPCRTSRPSSTRTFEAATTIIEEIIHADPPHHGPPARTRSGRHADAADLGFEDRLAMLVEREASERDTKRLATRLRFAGLRQ
jgi:transposase